MSEPNPHAALQRLLAKPRAYQRKQLRLSVWCETGNCSPIRVFAVHDGLLVQCRSDADVSDVPNHYPRTQKWSPRRAFFIEWWLDHTADSTLQVVCECAQTKARLVDVRKVAASVPESNTRNVRLSEVLSS